MLHAEGKEAAAQLAEVHARAVAKPWGEAELASLLDNQAVYALISRDDGLEGFVLAWAAAGDAEVLTVAVVPEARRKGVGAALVTAAGVMALVRGAAHMHVEVAENNAAARALYTKLGYEEAGRRHAYYAGEGGAVDALVMRRALPWPVV